jgi:hypothetical protein
MASMPVRVAEDDGVLMATCGGGYSKYQWLRRDGAWVLQSKRQRLTELYGAGSTVTPPPPGHALRRGHPELERAIAECARAGRVAPEEHETFRATVIDLLESGKVLAAQGSDAERDSAGAGALQAVENVQLAFDSSRSHGLETSATPEQSCPRQASLLAYINAIRVRDLPQPVRNLSHLFPGLHAAGRSGLRALTAKESDTFEQNLQRWRLQEEADSEGITYEEVLLRTAGTPENVAAAELAAASRRRRRAVSAWLTIQCMGNHMLHAIMRQLNAHELGRARAVCRGWRATASSDALWKPFAAGSAMLAALKARPECKLTWCELFTQQKNAQKRIAAQPPPYMHPKRSDYLLGIEVSELVEVEIGSDVYTAHPSNPFASRGRVKRCMLVPGHECFTCLEEPKANPKEGVPTNCFFEFNHPVEAGEPSYLNFGQEDDWLWDQLHEAHHEALCANPVKKCFSVSLFLIRKKDQKRLELGQSLHGDCANVNMDREHDDDDTGEYIIWGPLVWAVPGLRDATGEKVYMRCAYQYFSNYWQLATSNC